MVSDLRRSRSVGFLFAVVFLAAVVDPTRAVAAKLSPDDTARLLAGLAASENAGAVAAEPLIVDYRTNVGTMWQSYEKSRGAAMSEWARSASAGGDAPVVFYPFGGADFMTVQRLHPRATHYTLVAREPAGALPDLTETERLEERLAPFLQASHQFTTFGYFATAALRRFSKRRGEIEAISGILALSAARAGYAVRSIEALAFDEKAHEYRPVAAGVDTDWESIRLTLERGDGETVVLDYVVLDLQDEHLSEHESQADWIRRQAGNHTFLKAAGHALQTPSFSITARAILNHAPSILQDESGLGYPALNRSFEVRLFGTFEGMSTHLFDAQKKSGKGIHEQTLGAEAALIEAYAERTDVEPLPFKLGYAKAAGSSVQYGVRRKDGRAPHPLISVVETTLRPCADEGLNGFGQAVDAQVKHGEDLLDGSGRVVVVPVLRLFGVEPHAAVEVVGDPVQPLHAWRGRGVPRIDVPVRLEEFGRVHRGVADQENLPPIVEAAEHVSGRDGVGLAHRGGGIDVVVDAVVEVVGLEVA